MSLPPQHNDKPATFHEKVTDAACFPKFFPGVGDYLADPEAEIRQGDYVCVEVSEGTGTVRQYCKSRDGKVSLVPLVSSYPSYRLAGKDKPKILDRIVQTGYTLDGPMRELCSIAFAALQDLAKTRAQLAKMSEANAERCAANGLRNGTKAEKQAPARPLAVAA